ncbi:MAG: hypothetical protein JNL70_22440 [Saprospiraceae bacterium]|nr:hypothetical protein [Saprospiraceae bacterium]
MTENEIKLVKSSWAHFRHVRPEVIADAFYSKLFLDNPSVRKMFPNDMTEQNVKVVTMFNLIVARLDRFHELIDTVRHLAVRHKGYGVKEGHYKLVGDALLWTLKQGLDDDWNDEVEAAWKKCYTILSETMIEAAK